MPKYSKHFVLFLVILIAVFIFHSQIKRLFFRSQKFIIYNLEGKNYKLLVADEPAEWERGLMFVRKCSNSNKFYNSLSRTVLCSGSGDGMIFIFPDKQIRSFWNKNTFVDLDIYWLDDDKIVGKDFLPSIEKTKGIYTLTSPAPVNKVIEIIK